MSQVIRVYFDTIGTRSLIVKSDAGSRNSIRAVVVGVVFDCPMRETTLQLPPSVFSGLDSYSVVTEKVDDAITVDDTTGVTGNTRLL